MKAIFGFLLMCSLSVAHAQDSYGEKVKQLLELSGSVNTFGAAVDQILMQFKGTQPNVSDEFWDEFIAEIKVTALDDLTNLLTPIYKKHLTEEDLDGIIAFYNTPLGKKFAEKTPLITQESMVAGQQWGMELGSKIAEKLEENGY